MSQGNFPRSLTQNSITRQIYFELKYIDYDKIKDEIARMARVEYNTSIRRNVMNVDDIEDFANVLWR